MEDFSDSSNFFEFASIDETAEKRFYRYIDKFTIEDAYRQDDKEIIETINSYLQEQEFDEVDSEFYGVNLKERNIGRTLQLAELSKEPDFLSQGFNSPHRLANPEFLDENNLGERDIVVYKYISSKNSAYGAPGIKNLDVVGYLDTESSTPITPLKENLAESSENWSIQGVSHTILSVIRNSFEK